jgi:hypothetical protein
MGPRFHEAGPPKDRWAADEWISFVAALAHFDPAFGTH